MSAKSKTKRHILDGNMSDCMNSHAKAVAYLLVAALLTTFSPQQCLADMNTLLGGSLTGGGGGITATNGWDSSDTTLSWLVTYNGDLTYTYSYTFTVPTNSKGLSHIIFEVSESFTKENDYLGSDFLDENVEVALYNTGDESNPGIPGSMKGIKFEDEFPDNITPMTWTVTFDSTRMPVWGDFYAKDGFYNPGDIDVYAYNTGFTLTDTELNHIAVPDTYVPVPSAVLLGILGLGVAGIKLRKFA